MGKYTVEIDERIIFQNHLIVYGRVKIKGDKLILFKYDNDAILFNEDSSTKLFALSNNMQKRIKAEIIRKSKKKIIANF